MTDEGPCLLSAVAQRALIERGELSSRELVAASLARIARLDPKLNAIVTLVGDEAIRGAAEADERQARGEQLGILHGLPVVHKDLHETRGIRTTYGSPIHADFIPSFDALIVERQRRAGAIALGKTNTPEFGAGSQTYNTVFGATANPYDPSKTCGGSSGGTAVALACRFASLGDGSDMGGSLRNPASFCNVVGLRPSPGRVPEWPRDQAWFTLSVPGPMGRTVEDTALLLAAIARAPTNGRPSPCPIRARYSSARLKPICAANGSRGARGGAGCPSRATSWRRWKGPCPRSNSLDARSFARTWTCATPTRSS